MFNRGKLALRLGENGTPGIDSIYIEHNGLIRARGAEPDLLLLLQAVRSWGWMPRSVVLSGVDDDHLTAARAVGGHVAVRRTHVAPMLDLTVSGVDWMASVSANTRQQLRRSDRAYANWGALRIARAGDVEQALAFLDGLMTLHQTTWEKRGKPGAFAQPFFRRFHRALIARGMPRDEIDMLRISAGESTIGYLYNFRHRGRVLAYQSGFDYAIVEGPRKPGMTSHRMAIDMYAAEGVRAYDFLAGNDRYKRSLANSQTTLHWMTLYPALAGLLRG